MTIPCRIHLTTKKTYAFTDLFPFIRKEPEPEEDFDEDYDEDFDEEEGEVITDAREKPVLFPEPAPRPEFSTALEADGTITLEEDGAVTVFYSDPYLSGQMTSSSTFRIEPSGFVSLVSTGAFTSCLAFQNEKRFLCDYGEKGGIYSVTMHTHRLENSLTLCGGRLVIEYSVEIHGVPSEHNLLELEVKLP